MNDSTGGATLSLFVLYVQVLPVSVSDIHLCHCHFVSVNTVTLQNIALWVELLLFPFLFCFCFVSVCVCTKWMSAKCHERQCTEFAVNTSRAWIHDMVPCIPLALCSCPRFVHSYLALFLSMRSFTLCLHPFVRACVSFAVFLGFF